MNPYQQFTTSIQKRGLLMTAALAVKKVGVACSKIGDRWFDVRHGTDTRRLIELEHLDIASDNKTFGMRYEVTRARPLKKLFARLDLPKDGVFVDFGSGKGRVLMMAAELGFDRIVGVEFSHELCDIARKNLAVFQAKTGLNADIQVMEMDVVDYEIRPVENVFFMFNPFDSEIMKIVVDKISKSVHDHPRKTWLIYQYPECRDAIDANERFELTGRHQWSGCEFLVYENRELRG
jgi:SAM-dependent methyltransferase